MYCTIGSDVAVGIVGLQPQACVRPLLIDTNIVMGEERHPVVRHPSGQRNRHIRHVARLAHQRSLSVHSYNVDSRAAYLSKGYHCQRHGELQAYRPSRQCIGHWCQLPPVPFPRNRTAIAGRRLNTHTCTSRYEARDIAGYQRRRHFATTQVG